MKPVIIHIHIGSLIQKVEISMPASDSKTDLDLNQALLHSYSSQIQAQIQEALINAVKNAVETVEKDFSLDIKQETESH